MQVLLNLCPWMIRLSLILCFASPLLAAADLEIRSLKVIPGKEFSLEFLVINHGPDPADQPGCNVYFFADQKLVLSQAFNLPSLASGVSRKEQLALETTAQAITTVKVEIFDRRQADIQPSTNFLQVNVKPAKLRNADLEIVDAKADDIKEKDKSGFIVRLRNNGPDKIAASKLMIELQVFGQTIARSERRVERLDSGSETEARALIPNAGIIPSTNGVLLLRWSSADIDDPATSNNEYKIPVLLSLRMPDLLPLKTTVDKDGVLTFIINNKGTARAPATVTALYINGALVERYNTPELSPNRSEHFKYKTTRVSTEDKIVIVADFNADVEEVSEENNRQ